MKLLYGDAAARLVSGRIADPVASMAALVAQPLSRVIDGMICHVLSDDSMWQFDSASVLTTDNILVAVPTGAAAGAWLRLPGACELKLPFTFATADAAILYTIPTGALLLVHEFFWQITADMTGGASSAIGVSSSNKNDTVAFTTKGDFLGGSAGDVAATLTSALGSVYARGTIGTDWDTIAKRRTLFKPTETIRYDQITSTFAAGAGNVVVVGQLLRNLGA